MDAEQVQVPSTTRRSWLPRAHPISWWMLLITTLAILMTSIDAQILPTVLPAILKDFHLSDAEGGLLNSIFFFGTIVGAICFGIALGVSGVLVPPIAGYFIQTWGWNADYIMLAIATALALIPLILLKETVTPRSNLSTQRTPSA